MDILDEVEERSISNKPNTMLHVMCILGYIANGFWVLTCLIVLIVGSSLLPDLIPESRGDSDAILVGLYIGVTFILVICAICIWGLILAHQKKKSGVIIYGIANGIWALVNLISLQPPNLIFAVISIAFIIVIAINYNK